jgi:hypothetical protein
MEEDTPVGKVIGPEPVMNVGPGLLYVPEIYN